MFKMPKVIWPEEARLSDASTKGVKRGCDDMRSHLAVSFISSSYPLSPCLSRWNGGYISIDLSISHIIVYLRAQAPALVR